jgi:iron complex outermembrane receptor protein
MSRPVLPSPGPLRAVAWAGALCALEALSISLAVGLGTQALAQGASADQPLPEVRVTGTAIGGLDREGALPLTVLDRADIERSGARDTAELLQRLPFVQGGVATVSAIGNDSHGYSSASLHDLGDAYTLILLNGQRTAPFAGQGANGAMAGVDLGTIPLAMVERIEVLRDGASALYGADALGGVINIITRRDEDANEASIGYTHARGGAREWRLSAFKSVGSLQESGQNLSLGLSVSHRSALQGSARSFANRSVRTLTEGGQAYRYADASAVYAAPANLYGLYSPLLAAQGQCPSGLTPDQAGACLANLAAQIDLVPEQDQHSLMASYTRQFAPDQRLSLDLLLSRNRVRARVAPMPGLLFIPVGSPLYAAYPDTVGFFEPYAPVFATYRFDALGRRLNDDTHTLGDLALRLDGRHAGWAWQSGLKASVGHLDSRIGGSIGQAAAQSLVDTGVLDPFAAAPSAEALAAMQQARYDGRWLTGLSRLYGWQGQLSRPIATLPGGELTWALGLDARHEQLVFKPSAFAQGLPVGTQTQGDLRIGEAQALQASQASRQVWGAFSEWLAPLTPSFDVGAAVRADHDSLSGSALTGKAHTRWRLSPSVLGRASLGTGFRAPTLNQLRSPTQSGAITGDAVCTEALQAQATALGANPCTLGVSNAYYKVQGGNPELKPERSVQASIGLLIEPLAGHTLGADLWAVHIRDRIGVVNEATALADPAAVPGVWTTVPAGAARELALNARPQNLGRLMSTGLDLQASVRRGSAIGLVDSRLLLSTILREDARAYAGGPWRSAIGNAEEGAPTLRWKASWRNTLVRGAWSHSLTARYQSGYLDQAVALERLDAGGAPTGTLDQVRIRVPGQVLWDWQSSWQLNGNLQIQAGIVNLFDTRPPLSLSQGGTFQGISTGYDQRYFDARGRLIQMEARLSF